MPTFNVLEAKSNLSRLLEAIESGRESEIIIARNGRPVARLAPLRSKPMGKRLGVAEGKFRVPEDIDRDRALIERMFNGETG
jgi:antitoxin (DNA-binding transcriptional repressor) of toxin-antitoxin stability system